MPRDCGPVPVEPEPGPVRHERAPVAELEVRGEQLVEPVEARARSDTRGLPDGDSSARPRSGRGRSGGHGSKAEPARRREGRGRHELADAAHDGRVAADDVDGARVDQCSEGPVAGERLAEPDLHARTAAEVGGERRRLSENGSSTYARSNRCEQAESPERVVEAAERPERVDDEQAAVTDDLADRRDARTSAARVVGPDRDLHGVAAQVAKVPTSRPADRRARRAAALVAADAADRHGASPLAEQVGDRGVESLAEEIPEREVDRAHGDREEPLLRVWPVAPESCLRISSGVDGSAPSRSGTRASSTMRATGRPRPNAYPVPSRPFSVLMRTTSYVLRVTVAAPTSSGCGSGTEQAKQVTSRIGSASWTGGRRPARQSSSPELGRERALGPKKTTSTSTGVPGSIADPPSDSAPCSQGRASGDSQLWLLDRGELALVERDQRDLVGDGDVVAVEVLEDARGDRVRDTAEDRRRAAGEHALGEVPAGTAVDLVVRHDDLLDRRQAELARRTPRTRRPPRARAEPRR